MTSAVQDADGQAGRARRVMSSRVCGGPVAPKSRGTVRLRSADPADRPIVDMRFLSHPDDVAALARSIELARSVAATAAMKPFVVREVAPGRALKGEELANFIRNGATTYFHSSGACRMGKATRPWWTPSCASTASTTCASPTAPSCLASWPCRRCRPASSSPPCPHRLRLAEMLVGRSRSMREREQ